MGGKESTTRLRQLSSWTKEHKDLDSDPTLNIVLLGTGMSGKSTLFKQLELAFTSNDESLKNNQFYIQYEREKLPEHLRILCLECDKLGFALKEENRKHREYVFALLSKGERQKVPKDKLSCLYALWKDPAIQKVVTELRPSNLKENAEYFLNRLDLDLKEALDEDDISDDEEDEKDDEVTIRRKHQDYVRASIRTSGFPQIAFRFNGVSYQITDTGGQRNERKKWGHIISSYKCKCLVYVVSISQYNQVIYEDETKNSLQEALEFWEQIVNLPSMSDYVIVLTFSMFDVFQKKIKVFPLNLCFDDYKGGEDAEEGFRYIALKFIAKTEHKNIHCYRINLLDKDEVSSFWLFISKLLDDSETP